MQSSSSSSALSDSRRRKQQQQQAEEERGALAWIFAAAAADHSNPPTAASRRLQQRQQQQLVRRPTHRPNSTMRATLSASSHTSNTGSSDSDSSSAAVTFEATPKPKFSHTGARQRYEIRQLRTQVAHMELLLQQLVSPAARDARPPATDARERDAARKQLEHLVRSQRENQQLRARVLSHKKLARSLRRMLLQRVADSVLLSEKLFRPRSDFELMGDDRFMFAKMVAEVRDAHANLDANVRAVERHFRARGPSRDWRVGLDARQAVVLEVFVSAEVPFRKAEVDDAVKLLQSSKMATARPHDPRDFGGSSEMFAMTELTKITSPTDVGIYRQRQAGWRVGDERRSVLALVAYLDCVDEHANPVPGFVFKFQMWKLRTAHVHVNARTGEQEHSTTLQYYARISPTLVGGPYSLDWDRSEIERTLIPVFDRQIANRIQATENILIDRRISQS